MNRRQQRLCMSSPRGSAAVHWRHSKDPLQNADLMMAIAREAQAARDSTALRIICPQLEPIPRLRQMHIS